MWAKHSKGNKMNKFSTSKEISNEPMNHLSSPKDKNSYLRSSNLPRISKIIFEKNLMEFHANTLHMAQSIWRVILIILYKEQKEHRVYFTGRVSPNLFLFLQWWTLQVLYLHLPYTLSSISTFSFHINAQF